MQQKELSLNVQIPDGTWAAGGLKILYLNYKFLQMLMHKNNHGTGRNQKAGRVELI